jgi:hypothetical protein
MRLFPLALELRDGPRDVVLTSLRHHPARIETSQLRIRV